MVQRSEGCQLWATLRVHVIKYSTIVDLLQVTALVKVWGHAHQIITTRITTEHINTNTNVQLWKGVKILLIP